MALSGQKHARRARDELFVGYAGVYGDRLFAFESSANARGFPFLTGRDQRQTLRYRPRWRHPEKAAGPVNQMEAETMSHMINPITASRADLMLDVEAPDGRTFAIDDPALIETLRAGLDGAPQLTLLRSDKALTDCRPRVSAGSRLRGPPCYASTLARS